MPHWRWMDAKRKEKAFPDARTTLSVHGRSDSVYGLGVCRWVPSLSRRAGPPFPSVDPPPISRRQSTYIPYPARLPQSVLSFIAYNLQPSSHTPLHHHHHPSPHGSLPPWTLVISLCPLVLRGALRLSLVVSTSPLIDVGAPTRTDPAATPPVVVKHPRPDRSRV